VELPSQLKLVQFYFSKLAGVGEKTALRQALQIINWTDAEREAFSNSLNELSSLKSCKICHNYSDSDVCSICSDDSRVSSGQLCVVESFTDFMAIEKSGNYQGRYHILGGVLNPLMGIGPDELEIPKLVERIHSGNFSSVILAINPSVEGDATCSYLRNKINEEINVERIGFGIPMGGSLEYLDSLTIGKAFENRKSF
jgi:recombination protein RecR